MPACIWGHLGWVIHTTQSLIKSSFHWARWSIMKSRSVTRINWPPINERAYTIKRLLRRPINKGFDRSISQTNQPNNLYNQTIPNHTKPTKQQSKQSKQSKAKQSKQSKAKQSKTKAKPSQAKQASTHARTQASKHTSTHARKQPSNQATKQPPSQPISSGLIACY